jgi:branched-chain amino acid transport system ATP-binding protein
LLSVKDLTVKYGMFSAIDGVSIDVTRGQIVGIVGANGAGKSTMMNAISGTIRTTAGTLTFEDMDLSKMSAHAIVRAGVVQVPEGRRLFPEMTVYENLLVGSSHRRAKAERDENFDKVFTLFPRLKERETQLAATLSGGEQQMIAVARALMSSPRILLMDEPSLGLAPIVIQEIFKVVRELRKLGLTILLVEQNVHHCLQISDYAYVLETGTLVLQGTGQEVLDNPMTKAAYLGMAVQEESLSN